MSCSFCSRPTPRIRNRLAEHVEEDGLSQRVEFGEGRPALGAQFIRFVQDRRDPALLAKRGERYSRLENDLVGDSWIICAGRLLYHFGNKRGRLHPVEKVAGIDT